MLRIVPPRPAAPPLSMEVGGLVGDRMELVEQAVGDDPGFLLGFVLQRDAGLRTEGHLPVAVAAPVRSDYDRKGVDQMRGGIVAHREEVAQRCLDRRGRLAVPVEA